MTPITLGDRNVYASELVDMSVELIIGRNPS